ncbi:MAG: adenylyl-sulfate kinase [Nitrospirota bacterium]
MKRKQGFAIWITGIPASGKSSITRELVGKLHEQGVLPAVLESDALRSILTPEPTYGPEERDRFYRQMAQIGEMLCREGIPVIFDATANRRGYRDYARTRIASFLEVLVECPLEFCRTRDPKGIYAAADQGKAMSVPGVQAPFEPPLAPDLVVDGRDDPGISADAIVRRIRERGDI